MHDYDRGMVNYVLDVMKHWETDEEFVRQVKCFAVNEIYRLHHYL